jgi:hypothetical protein
MMQQRGGTLVGFVVGVLVGLGAALAVAVYVTKVPVPFLNKGQSRSNDQDVEEARKNKDWDPNAPLYGKNPAKPAAPAARCTHMPDQIGFGPGNGVVGHFHHGNADVNVGCAHLEFLCLLRCMYYKAFWPYCQPQARPKFLAQTGPYPTSVLRSSLRL